MNVHETAQAGFKQGNHYDQSRPSYSDELVAHVIERLHRGQHDGVRYDILELGAGTGKFTRKLVENLQNVQEIRCLVTEPAEGFLEVLRHQSPDLETLVCSATTIPLPELSVQNIICAQCFHWFATDESLREISRVLVPGGRLILVWLTRDFKIDWVKRMEDILTLYYEGTPRKMLGDWKSEFDSCQSFRCLEHTENIDIVTMKGDKNVILNHFLSISVIVRLDLEEKDIAMKRFQSVLDEQFRDDEDIILPFKSEFYCTEKI